MGIKRTLLRGFAAGVATVALIAGGASAASALEYTPNPANSGQTITVTSNSSLAADSYRVGICTSHGIGLFQAPACGAMSNVAHPGGRQLVTTIPGVSKTRIANMHKKLPGHAETFDCSTAGACEVVIVKHRWYGSTTVERAPLVFN
ncbi:hypothetical protein [Leucobacter luti]|uniref:hypothetical protein n=1 Tax=Leucobacter luti TaxID=340320 RepID=UPI003CFECFA2